MWKKIQKHTSSTDDALTPLDKIRQEEAKLTSQVLQARRQAEAILQAARLQAEQMKKQAMLDGARDGQIACVNKIAEAQNQAQHIVEQARSAAEGFSTQSKNHVEDAAQWAFQIVLGLGQRSQQR